MTESKRKVLIFEFEQWLDDNTGAWGKEAKCIPGRRFSFDYVIWDFGNKTHVDIAVEINGGQWVKGRHNRGGKGYESDLTKSNLAQINGFVYLQYTYEMMARGEHFDQIGEVFNK